MAKEKIELTLQDESGQEYVAYPFVESEDVTFSNGMDIETMIAQDVSLPTIVHSETSFKAGVGDSNISNSIVDSSVANMTIEGQTYQNILPEPTLRNAMTDGETMQKINEGHENVEVVDGISKSAILTGQTLVNLGYHGGVQHPTYQSIVEGWSKIEVKSGNEQSYNAWYVKTQNMLKPNTTYALLTWVKENTLSSVWSAHILNTSESPFTSGSKVWQSKETGFYFEKITTGNSTDDKVVALRTATGTGNSVGQYIMYRLVLIEYQDGMENWDIPYFEGMQSVKMPVLTTTGKNLFDSSTEIVTGQGIDSITGLPYNASTHSYTGFLRAKPNTTYTITQSHNRTWVFAYNKNKEYIGVVKTDILSGGNFTTPNDTYYIRLDFNTTNISEIVNGVQIEEGSVATSYEPYKTNILSTPEEVVLRSFNNVKDTLNLMTGEYVQRIKEMVLNGSETYNSVTYTHNNTNLRFDLPLSDIRTTAYDGLLCDSLPVLTDSMIPEGAHTKSYIAGHADSNRIVVVVEKSKLLSENIEGFRAWLQANPITIQYELKTPIIKTVDLSSSGNWDKVVLDGSENWGVATAQNQTKTILFQTGNYIPKTPYGFAQGFKTKTSDQLWTDDLEAIAFNTTHSLIQIRILRTIAQTTEELKSYLQQNPITVWCQTATHQDSTNVKEMLSFSNGHVQLSSAEGSLIPSLSYETPTSNSYQLDLAKPSTKYTMKSSSASGSFTIDGTQYNFNTNGTFTTPSTMNNKLMIANGTVTDLMFIEGDVTSKTIPYFKGIKSAFEDEDKIEVLSTGANIVDYLNPSFAGSSNISHLVDNGEITLVDDATQIFSFVRIPINKVFNFKKGQKYHLSFEMQMTNALVGEVKIVTPNVITRSNVFRYEINNEWTVYNTTITPQLDFSVNSLKQEEKGYETCLEFMLHGGTELSGKKTLKIRNVILSTNIVPYEPYKSNNTKIPLLSPLRSLPNGVCDEIILDRENNKAQIIQRVGSIVLDGSDSEEWHFAESNRPDTNTHYVVCANSKVFGERLGKFYSDVSHGVKAFFQDKFAEQAITVWKENGMEMFALHLQDPTHFRVLQVKILKNRLHSTTIEAFREWLSLNPITVYYELATPVTTEIDLEGYPYIYKDGHIFLDTDIVPISEITYSINQQQQIEASNEDLMRHEKKITNLHKLIGTYVNVEYESTLLALNLELK